MLLLIGFLRKKTTKIYLLTFTVLFSVILVISSFINYYSFLNDELFKSNSFITIISKNDYYDILSKHKHISSFEKAILFTPDYSCSILANHNSDSKFENSIYWDDFFIKGLSTNNNAIFVFSDSDLSNDQIDLGIESNVLQRLDENEFIIDSIAGKSLSIYHSDVKFEFTINNIYESTFSEMRVSEKVFQNLLEKEDYFVYKVITENYTSADSLVEELKEYETDEDYIISFSQKQTVTATGQDVAKLKELINTLRYSSYIIVFIFAIIFSIVENNIIQDESNIIKTERLLGFNKKHILFYMFLKITFLIILSILISLSFSILTQSLINYMYGLKLNINNYGFPILMYVIWFLLNLIFYLTYINNRVHKV